MEGGSVSSEFAAASASRRKGRSRDRSALNSIGERVRTTKNDSEILGVGLEGTLHLSLEKAYERQLLGLGKFYVHFTRG